MSKFSIYHISFSNDYDVTIIKKFLEKAFKGLERRLGTISIFLMAYESFLVAIVKNTFGKI